MLNRYLESPVLMSFDSNPKPISEIPFPAVTICNMNKARKQMQIIKMVFLQRLEMSHKICRFKHLA